MSGFVTSVEGMEVVRSWWQRLEFPQTGCASLVVQNFSQECLTQRFLDILRWLLCPWWLSLCINVWQLRTSHSKCFACSIPSNAYSSPPRPGNGVWRAYSVSCRCLWFAFVFGQLYVVVCGSTEASNPLVQAVETPWLLSCDNQWLKWAVSYAKWHWYFPPVAVW